MNNKIIFVVGMAGSGKSVVSDELVNKGFSYLRFGKTVIDELKKRDLPITEENEALIRKSLREEHGMGAMALLNIKKIDELIKSSNVVVDGLYSWAEYKVLKEKYADSMYVLAVYAPPILRYKRLENRFSENDKDNRFRSFSNEDSKKRDYFEIENIEKAGPIAMADFTITNIESMEDAKKQLNFFFK